MLVFVWVGISLQNLFKNGGSGKKKMKEKEAKELSRALNKMTKVHKQYCKEMDEVYWTIKAIIKNGRKTEKV